MILFFAGIGQNIIQTIQGLIALPQQDIAQPSHTFLRITRNRFDFTPFLINHFRLLERIERNRHFQSTFRHFRRFGIVQHHHICCQRRTGIAFLQQYFTAQQGKYLIRTVLYIHTASLLGLEFVRRKAVSLLNNLFHVFRCFHLDGIILSGGGNLHRKQHHDRSGNSAGAGWGQQHNNPLCTKKPHQNSYGHNQT